MKAKYQDVLNKEDTIFKIELIEKKEDILVYKEDDALVKINFNGGSCSIIRDGVVYTTIELSLGKEGKCEVKSPYGNMNFTTKAIEILTSPDYFEIEYQLLENNDVISHIKFILDLKN